MGILSVSKITQSKIATPTTKMARTTTVTGVILAVRRSAKTKAGTTATGMTHAKKLQLRPTLLPSWSGWTVIVILQAVQRSVEMHQEHTTLAIGRTKAARKL